MEGIPQDLVELTNRCNTILAVMKKGKVGLDSLTILSFGTMFAVIAKSSGVPKANLQKALAVLYDEVSLVIPN